MTRTKGIAKLLGSLAGLLMVYCLVVLFPQPLFAHKIDYRDFRIYSHDAIDHRIYGVLDEVSTKLERSDLRRPGRIHRLFLCDSAAEFAFFVPHRRRATSINYQLGHNIFVRSASIPENRVGEPGHYGSTLTWIATHEVVHTLQQDSIGLRAMLALPFWKREGYAEYIAEESGLSVRDGVHLLLNGSPVIILSDQVAIPRQYLEARLLVEYYFATRKSSFQQLVNDPIDISALRQEMVEWAHKDR
jgi:hypothetical protein